MLQRGHEHMFGHHLSSSRVPQGDNERDQNTCPFETHEFQMNLSVPALSLSQLCQLEVHNQMGI